MYFSGHITGLSGAVMHLKSTKGKNAIRAREWERCQYPTEQIQWSLHCPCMCMAGFCLSNTGRAKDNAEQQERAECKKSQRNT